MFCKLGPWNTSAPTLDRGKLNVHTTTVYYYTVVQWQHLYLPPPRKLCFCQSLFVCLCVSKITQKVMEGSFWHFQGMLGMAKLQVIQLGLLNKVRICELRISSLNSSALRYSNPSMFAYPFRPLPSLHTAAAFNYSPSCTVPLAHVVYCCKLSKWQILVAQTQSRSTSMEAIERDMA